MIKLPKLTVFLVSPRTLNRLKNKSFVFYHTKKRRWKLPLVADYHVKDGMGYALFRGKYLGSYYV